MRGGRWGGKGGGSEGKGREGGGEGRGEEGKRMGGMGVLEGEVTRFAIGTTISKSLDSIWIVYRSVSTTISSSFQ
jgi:hypothetical protein